jgi:hypothetical protein
VRGLMCSVAGATSAVFGLAALVLLVGALILARSGWFVPLAHPNLAGIGLSAEQLMAVAATQLEAATAKGGSGYSFEVVQTSTIKARPGGPRIDIPDPSNAFKTIGQADEYFFYALIEKGAVRSDGFWSEMRTGPEPGEVADFEKANLRRAALVIDGVRWRNDQQGWYQVDVLPGVGLDPETSALLPSLLRDSTGSLSKEPLTVGGVILLRVDATGTVAELPGLVAADGAAFTKLIAPLEFGFDAQGRLARIHAIALNTNMDDFDLVVDTVITLIYDNPGSLPQPDPIWVPPTPTQEVGA